MSSDKIVDKKDIKKLPKLEIAKILCNLNCFDTPTALGLGRQLTHQEIGPVFSELIGLIPNKYFLEIWNQPGIWKGKGIE